MERSATATRRSHGGGASLKAEQLRTTRGNQKGEEEDSDDTPEQLDGADECDSDDGASRSGSSAGSPTSASASVATPPSSPGTGGYSSSEEADEPAQETPEAAETGDSLSDGSQDLSLDDVTSDNQDKQLRSDLAVLAAHLQQQEIEFEKERSASLSLQSQLRANQETLQRELENLLIENEALRHQNALLLTERNDLVVRERAATEAHEEVLRALKTQQQRDDHARTIIAALVKERDALKKQVDESKLYCRRLEEDVVALRAEQQHLRAENQTLQTGLKASAGQKKDCELEVLREQERIIESLRADVLQMEFEYKTLALDKEKLSHRVATLQRQSESHSTSYDVICLRGDGDGKLKHGKKRLSITTRGSGASGNSSNDGFTNLITLPNRVDECGPVAMSVPRPRAPVGSLMSKTLSSAKKKLFQSSAPTVVLPQ